MTLPQYPLPPLNFEAVLATLAVMWSVALGVVIVVALILGVIAVWGENQ